MGPFQEKSDVRRDFKAGNLQDGSDVEPIPRNEFKDTPEGLRARRK
jgi:hypothetical protein